MTPAPNFDAVVAAARRWVERIVDHPNDWADREDIDLIDAVYDAFPTTARNWTRTETP